MLYSKIKSMMNQRNRWAVMRLMCLTVLLSLSSLVLFAQEIKPFKVSIEFKLDEKGNAQVTYGSKMNAGQWDNFKRSMGNNQSLLKRQIERGLPAYFLSDFEYKEDAMDRAYTLTFNAYGVCKVNSTGKWVIDLDTKNPDVTKVSDNVYMMISEASAGGQLIQTNQKIIFPESASDIKEEKDAFGKAHFTFSMGNTSMSGKVMQYGGILLIISGLFLGWKKSKQA